MYINLGFAIYFGKNLPWQVRLYNRQELFNEMLTALCTFQLVLFTDFVTDVKLRTKFGWILIATVIILCAVNLYLTLR